MRQAAHEAQGEVGVSEGQQQLEGRLDSPQGSVAWQEANSALQDEAYELYTQGLTVREVADRQGCSVETAHRRIKYGEQAQPPQSPDTLKQGQIRSLMRQKRIVLGVIAHPAHKVDHGRVVIDPLTSQPMVDQEMILKASAELRRIEEAVMRLAGTRAPVVHEVHEITEEAIDAEYQRLITSLPRLPALALPRGGGEPVGGTLQGGEARVPPGAQAG